MTSTLLSTSPYLLFCPVPPAVLSAVRQEGLPDRSGGILLWTQLEAAQAASSGPILVVKSTALPAPPAPVGQDQVRVEAVPPHAILNADPYRPPRSIVAAGGFVMRPGPGGPEVLLIFRRGIWDLPKGKVDPGETVEQTALREVREEVGITTLSLRRPLGTTLHGYPEREVYRVKTTHWFLMETPERDFTPEAEEDIREIAWMPWEEARQRMGFETLRMHMAQIEPALRSETWLDWTDRAA